ncbi:hypothetical protein K470DRAFT_260740 [Piedraia hortae CBS 480.64]|uniref:Uncharacterized protein n=1 Tax=Piedraia hortae CBS 480.64 TaxID=1314780 RepID=A0A6A7BQN2_9PEZI|nr:hypothetical protein K470DRAFT_260740 [Piedraia hortae CBS 480.64]
MQYIIALAMILNVTTAPVAHCAPILTKQATTSEIANHTTLTPHGISSGEYAPNIQKRLIDHSEWPEEQEALLALLSAYKDGMLPN